MNAEIISVGTELLLGDIVDTNAAYLSQMLSHHGISLHYRSTVGDNARRLRDGLQIAFSRADLVLTIGGLGPTQDDLTKETVADVLNDALHEDASHRRWLAERMSGRTTVPVSFWKQALVPANGLGIPNPSGTALGAIFEKDGKIVICLPGPPNELIPMVEQSIEPYLQDKTRNTAAVIISRTLRIIGMGESVTEDRIKEWITADNPTVAPYAKTGEVHLRITARALTEAEAIALIGPVEEALREQLGDHVYGIDDETLESVVIALLQQARKTVALGESCTGGLIAKRLTDVPDASRVFGLGLVTYSNEAKAQYLGVRPGLFTEVGAVSPEVARAMAIGSREAGKSDIGLSVTGIAGPGGGSLAKPVGTVHIGLAWDGGVVSEHHHFLGSRNDVSYRASQYALALLRRYLINPTREEFQNNEQVFL